MQGSSSVVVDTIEGQPWLAIVAQCRGKHSPARLRGATPPPKPAPATDAQRRSASGGFPPSDLAADLVRSNCLVPTAGDRTSSRRPRPVVGPRAAAINAGTRASNLWPQRRFARVYWHRARVAAATESRPNSDLAVSAPASAARACAPRHRPAGVEAPRRCQGCPARSSAVW